MRSKWRVTDFVTLGSPLAHADILLARDRVGLEAKQNDREFPTCLPVLEKVIFFYKCGYCESYFGATQPVAIEHYRSKSEVAEGKKKLRGYYWLAATWENLFPSCTDCNSRRTHLFPDGTEVVRGKGNEFPLADPKTRAKSPKALLNKEGALLLDPSSAVPGDDPALHLEFLVEEETVGLVRPAITAGQENAKGKASIWVYALDRPGLIKFRRDLAHRLLFQCRMTELSFRLHQATPGDGELNLEYEENLRELRGFLDPDKPYVGMVRRATLSRVQAVGRGVQSTCVHERE